MIFIGCTKKMAEGLKLSLKPLPDINHPGLLGDWTANVFIYRRKKYYIFSNEMTLFSFLLTDISKKTIEQSFLNRLERMLKLAEIPEEKINAVMLEASEIVFTKSLPNRPLVGCLNNLIFLVGIFMDADISEGAFDLERTNIRMNRIFFTYIPHTHAIEELYAVLGLPEPADCIFSGKDR
ncbi:MAG TPA: hypothetical protein PKG52_12415 [bacterium]|nr:hypothetical protein [bacterium]HPS31500.1 hypothetical protein [bacterium]